MALDALCMAALAQELRRTLDGGRVDKVYQPGRNEVVLAIRTWRDNERLLLSAEPGYARAQCTGVSRENPAQPPVLCMLLRKRLTGARLTGISQPPGERLLRFTFQGVNELGDAAVHHLILEAMGRSTNLILTDGEDRVLSCTHRVEGDLAAGRRQVMPGLFYQPPDPHPGIPPLILRELEFRGKETPEAGADRLAAEIEAGSYTPVMLLRDGEPFDFSFLPILQYGPAVENRRYATFAQLLDDFYTVREAERLTRQRGGDLLKSVRSLRERLERKTAAQLSELAAARDRDHLRVKGDLITSNLYRLEKGLTSATLENYYTDPPTPLAIPLDPLLTPQQNAAKYYREHAKARTAERVLADQLRRGSADLDYLDSVLESIALAEGDRDIAEIRRELEETGYLRRKKAVKKELRQRPKLLEHRTAGGFRVTVGRNNTQNDLLTTKLAGKSDLWFHAQKTHGAHVILWCEGSDPGEADILEAAQLAAWYSQARGAGKTPVDYTPVKFVKKPAGARPGMVVYTTCRTLLVEPKDKKSSGSP